MIRAVALSLWVSIVALGASTGAGHFAHVGAQNKAAGPQAPALESRKTRSVQAPVLSSGAVQGYIVAQFAYTAETAALKTLTISPDAILLDEALRWLYARGENDLGDISRINVEELTKALRERVNARLGSAVVKDVMAHELTFVSRDQVKKQ